MCVDLFQGGMINWNRLFPPLRQRRNNYQDARQSEQQASPPLEVSEEQVIGSTHGALCAHFRFGSVPVPPELSPPNPGRPSPCLQMRRTPLGAAGQEGAGLASPRFCVFQVARLMEMGFSRGDALEALRASNNDLNVATNFLLQH
ncbi:Ubiquitin-associated domain-containing protein 2 [Galemys pyrenaicus]|uniref:Ubiquitin-associated domain-containing protein 2 n=1 Tax=Galemys pyrenaicus TaxID=202257 RepID=A0A8J6DQK2_GALPY|nr:Ubiquitin-associated domain-containing protein 2 [Galemys pyrenaicus]